MITVSYKHHPTIPSDAIISFDIGIINLAYCILSLNPRGASGSNYIIHEWEIIDLLADSKENCSQPLKSGKNKGVVCGKPATYQNNTVFFCTTHGKNKPDFKRHVTAANASEQDLKIKLFRELDKRPHFLDVETVLLEIQHKHAREKIKNVGTAINDYFVLRGIIDNKKEFTVRPIDAKNKLTMYDGPPLACHLKTQYKRNKWYGVKYCAWVIRGQTFVTKYFNACNKKDDLADSMLQGAWYLSYGQHGKKAPLPVKQQQLVFADNNISKYTKIKRGTKPKPKATKLSLSNIKYLVKRGILNKSEISKDLISYQESFDQSIEFFFGTKDFFTDKIS